MEETTSGTAGTTSIVGKQVKYTFDTSVLGSWTYKLTVEANDGTLLFVDLSMTTCSSAVVIAPPFTS
jgi:hypothetical protein